MKVFIIHFGERAQQGGKKQDSEKPWPTSAVTWAEFLNLPEHLLLQLNEADATYVTTLGIKCTNSAHCLTEGKLSAVVWYCTSWKLNVSFFCQGYGDPRRPVLYNSAFSTLLATH